MYPTAFDAAPTSAPDGLPAIGYEYRTLVFPRWVSREEAKRALTDAADTQRWELARTLMYLGGARRVWIRRRIQRVSSTLPAKPNSPRGTHGNR